MEVAALGSSGHHRWSFTSSGPGAVHLLGGARFRSLHQALDGSWVVVRLDGRASQLRMPKASKATLSSGRVLVQAASGPVTVSEHSPLLTAKWVERGADRSLRVDPSTAARQWLGAAAEDALWAEVVHAQPSADSPGMRDQFVCHQQFAPTKQAWFLEPDRPAVGYPATVAARCNPGAVEDGG